MPAITRDGDALGRPDQSGWGGYGDVAVTSNRPIAVLRSGYGDGFPKTLADGADILSVGMQYTARVMHDGVDPRGSIGVTSR